MDKKGSSRYFDMPMGSFDGAEICELIGCLLLHSLNNIIDPSNHGLYRVNNCTPRKGDVIALAI